MASNQRSVRMRPISLLSLVILICLAVMAILAVTTANATFATTEKQASFLNSSCENETAAQEFLADIDARLYQVRRNGGDGAAAAKALAESAPDGAVVEDDTVSAQFGTADGRTLTISIDITDEATYTITEWKTSTRLSDKQSGETLWSGTAG